MPLQEVHTGFTFNFDGSKMAAIQRGVKRASTGLNTIAAKTEAFSQRAGGMIARAGQLIGAYAGFRVLKSLTSDYAKGADAVAKFSTALGLNTERYQGLVHAVKLGGTDTMNLNNALGQLSKRALEAGQGLSTNVRAFRELGVEYKDAQGNLKSADQLFLDVSDGLVNLEDKEKRTGLAMQLLGRSGKTLLPTMLQGSKAIREQIAEYKKLGGVLSKDQLKAAEKFNDEMLRVKTVLTGVRNIIAAKLLPAISRNLEAFRKWWVEGRNAERALRALKLTAIFTGIVIGQLFAASVIKKVSSFAKGIWAGVQALRAMGLAGALAAIKVWALVAAFAIVGLVIHDLVRFAQGKDSAIGRILGDSSTAKDLKKALLDIWKALKEGYNDIMPKLKQAWEDIKPAVTDLWTEIKPLIGPAFQAGVWMLIGSLQFLAAVVQAGAWAATQSIKLWRAAILGVELVVASVREAFEWLFDIVGPGLKKIGGSLDMLLGGALGRVADKAIAAYNAFRKLLGLQGNTDLGKLNLAAANKRQHERMLADAGLAPSAKPFFKATPQDTVFNGAPSSMPQPSFGAGFASKSINTNLASGAVAVTVQASGDAKQIAAEVTRQVGKGISKVITGASRDLVKAPQGQR